MVKVELRTLRKAYVSEGRTSEPVNGLSLEMPAGGITARDRAKRLRKDDPAEASGRARKA